MPSPSFRLFCVFLSISLITTQRIHPPDTFPCENGPQVECGPCQTIKEDRNNNKAFCHSCDKGYVNIKMRYAFSERNEQQYNFGKSCQKLWIVIAIGVGGLVVLTLLIILLICCCCRCRKNRQKKQSENAALANNQGHQTVSWDGKPLVPMEGKPPMPFKPLENQANMQQYPNLAPQGEPFAPPENQINMEINADMPPQGAPFQPSLPNQNINVSASSYK